MIPPAYAPGIRVSPRRVLFSGETRVLCSILTAAVDGSAALHHCSVYFSSSSHRRHDHALPPRLQVLVARYSQIFFGSKSFYLYYNLVRFAGGEFRLWKKAA